MSKAWELDLSQGEKLVLLALCDHANDDGVCYPSQAFLASKCSMSYRSVINQIKRLESCGILTSERRQKAGSRQSNSYTINLNNYKSQCENSAHAESAHANFAHANSAPTNVQNTTELCANSAHSFKEEPSINHQLEPSDIGDGVTPASQAGLPQKKTTQKNHRLTQITSLAGTLMQKPMRIVMDVYLFQMPKQGAGCNISSIRRERS